MSQPYTANAALLLTGPHCIVTGGPGTTQRRWQLSDPLSLPVLEAFVHQTDIDLAYQQLCRAPSVAPDRDTLAARVPAAPDPVELLLYQGAIRMVDIATGAVTDLTDVSRSGTCVLLTLTGSAAGALRAFPTPSRAQFEQAVDALCEQGLLVPPFQKVDWGQLRRFHAICKGFGFSRGTPVDRYYLNRFVEEIRERVAGKTVELGGVSTNATWYRWSHVTSFTAVDVRPGPGVDLVGDIHDPGLLPPDSADAVIAFNVLEHCAQPWVVVDNMRSWLRTGGHAFCMVPGAQRIHQMPSDFWRPMPGAVHWMFRAFSDHQVRQYGNPTSVIASYMGIAAEELSAEELDATHPDYPAAICVTARK
jgi:hypothetical protein